MEADGRTRETERRVATVLFADITGFTTLNERLDPEDAYTLVTDCIKLLDGIARRHGASVDKYMGDCIMAVFGVPLAMEDAPRAAVNAAIEIRNAVQEFNRERRLSHPLDVHSGINTGLMISGDISGPVLREFAVMGDAVNIAARLKDLSPAGEIWIGEETARSVREFFQLEQVSELELKGKRKRVSTYAVRSTEPRIHRAQLGERLPVWSPLVGRAHELDRLRGHLRELGQGRGGAVALVGEAGIGKTRLVAELAASAEAETLRWLEGRAVAVGGNLSFHPIRDLIRRSCRIAESEDDESAGTKLREAVTLLLGERADEVLPFLFSLLGIRPPPEYRKRLQGVSGEGLEQLTIGAVTRLLEALARDRPLVLGFEDLHWADESSIALLESLLPVCLRQPILIVAAARPNFPSTSGRFQRAMHDVLGQRAEDVPLEPLGAGASEQLMSHLFERGSIPIATLDAIDRRTSGNPFFIEEVARSLLESGALALRQGRLVATARIAEVEIPHTVQEVVMARIDRLALRRKAVLQAASVLGRSVGRGLLAEIAQTDALDECLEGLVESQFLVPRDDGDELSYVFKHPLIRDVCYDVTSRATRQDLHLRAAQAIEASVPDTTPGYTGMLAFHFGHGGDVQSAEDYLLLAGEEAARVAAPSEALQLFREASRLYLSQSGGVDPEKRIRLEKNIALAHYYRGELETAVEHFNGVLTQLGARIPATRRELIWRTARTLGSVLPRLYLPRLQRSLPAATDHDQEVCDLMFMRARAQTNTDPIRFFTDTVEHMREVWRVDPATVRGAGSLFAGSAGLFAYAGRFSISRRFLATARRFLDAEDAGERMTFGLHRFLYFYLSGDPDEAGEVERELIDEAVGRGRLWDVCTYLGIVVLWKTYRGDYDEARESIEYLMKLEELYAYATARETHQGVNAALKVERGELDGSVAACNLYLDANPVVLPNLLGLGLKSKALVERGELDLASAALEQAEALVRGAPAVPAFHYSACQRSQLLLEVTRLERSLQDDAGGVRVHRRAARRAARRALRGAENARMLQPEVFKLVARLEALSGSPRRAERWWQRALDASETFGARPQAARIRAEIATRGAGAEVAGVSPRQHLERARRDFEELGLERELCALPDEPGR